MANLWIFSWGMFMKETSPVLHHIKITKLNVCSSQLNVCSNQLNVCSLNYPTLKGLWNKYMDRIHGYVDRIGYMGEKRKLVPL